MQGVDENRLKLWQALATLFLDTEITDSDFDYIARVVLETGYSSNEVRAILWGEVFPVLEANLRSVAGEWAGWTNAWLLEHLKVGKDLEVRPAAGHVGKEIARCWDQLAARLPSGFV